MVELGMSSLATAFEVVKTIVSVYDGYEKGRFMKCDEAVRAEIQRRCEMLTRHAEKLQSDVHKMKFTDARNSFNESIEMLQIFNNEVQFSISGNKVSLHKGIGNLNSGAVRKLVNHDSACLKSLVDCTNEANAIAEDITAKTQESILTAISNWNQSINRSRNRFLERNMYIDGLTNR